MLPLGVFLTGLASIMGLVPAGRDFLLLWPEIGVTATGFLDGDLVWFMREFN